MIFGNVLRKLAVSVLFLPMTLLADRAIINAEETVNLKLDRCLKASSRSVAPIEDVWIDSLTPKQKRLVVYALSSQAMFRCGEEAYQDYAWVLVKHAAKTGDKKKLNELISLIALPDDKMLEENLPVGYESELKRLSESPVFYYPFDGTAMDNFYYKEQLNGMKSK